MITRFDGSESDILIQVDCKGRNILVLDSGRTINIEGCRTTRIYCRTDCPAGRRMKADNRVFFKSYEDARGNGYRACKVCKPDPPDVMPETFFTAHYDSPLGRYILVSSQRGIVLAKPDYQVKNHLDRWQWQGIRIEKGGEYNYEAAGELKAYFTGTLFKFNVPLDLRGTDFQRKVWQALCGIPYGETRSYGQVARSLFRPGAGRAVGRANGTNPVSIIVPCHRVIGTNGKLTGYGGGLDRKQALLDLESAHLSGLFD